MPQPFSRMVNLLFISDSPEEREMFRQAFAVSPHLEVRNPIGTKDAIPYLSRSSPSDFESRPDLILLDLPPKTGQDFEAGSALLQRLKTATEFRGIPLVLFADDETLYNLPSSQAVSSCSIVRKPSREADVRRMAYHFGEYWGMVARVPPRLDTLQNTPPKDRPSPPVSLEKCVTKGTIRPVEILVVDDNNDDAILFQESLASLEQIQLTQILDNPDAAWQYLHKQGQFRDVSTPDVVVLDIHMPQRTGFALLDDIKADPALGMLPVVILTASRYEEDIWESYSRGACSFVEKPSRFEWLCELAVRFANYWTTVAYLPKRFRD